MAKTRSLSPADQLRYEQIQAKKAELRRGLPHLYERKWYQWAWDFFKSSNRMNLLCANNQASKSSTQIRKCIEWAGNPKLWDELWPNGRPNQFWYFYPSKDVMKREFNTKWKKEFLPRDAYKDHPTYGWKEIKDKGDLKGIAFNSGVDVYFMFYSQALINLQAATVFAVFGDEEMPEECYSELSARLIATNGYFHMVFTATLNQLMWWKAMEGKGDDELFPDAWKRQVSAYDCQYYKDGTAGAFTEERIEEIKRSCKSETEVLRRVYGRFVTEEGRKYGAFDPVRHMCKPFAIPPKWNRYVGVDYGSGGTNHKPAIVFVAVRPDYRYAVAYKGWRGDDGDIYTAQDIFNKFLELRGTERCVDYRYDHASKDFGTIAQRSGESFLPAEKSHQVGEQVMNTLFGNDMLQIFDIPEMQSLSAELISLMRKTDKRRAQDDFCDGLRFSLTSIPFDWVWAAKQRSSSLAREPREDQTPNRPLTEKELKAQEIRDRRGELEPVDEEELGWLEMEGEFDEWNGQYGT